MKSQTLTRLLIVLLALASLGTTALLAMLTMNRQPTGPSTVLQGQAVHDEPLPIIATLPDFTFTDQDNQPFSSKELAGKVWVGHFFFIDCSSICPLTSSRMLQLQMDLKKTAVWDKVRLVSFSVNPTADTPDRLAQHARDYRADTSHWTLLTGDRDAMRSLVSDSFKLVMEDNPDNPAMPINHSPKLVLVDQLGRIRGYYDVLTPEFNQYDQLLGDIQQLAAPAPGNADGSSPAQR